MFKAVYGAVISIRVQHSCCFQYPAGEEWGVVQILWGWGYVPLLRIFGWE